MTKQRLSISVDEELAAAGREATAEGRADSLSTWVNDALRLKVAHDRRMQALDDFIAAHEAVYGEITEGEMREASRRARARAAVVRGPRDPDASGDPAGDRGMA